MRAPPPLSRRLVTRGLAWSGAVFCTFFANGDFRAVRPAVADRASVGPASVNSASVVTARPAVPLILIDPGHGGRDSGARGIAGTLEKDVTFNIGLALRAALAARGRYRVELTRAGDQFVAPEDRVDMAHGRKADLFLSLHADTYPVASVRGAAVYTLARRASDPETEARAARENATARGRPAGGELARQVSDILHSLAEREARALSSRIARRMVRDLERDVPVLPSPSRHANFAVLQTAGIPSLLIEMGFLSNRADEAALGDAAHQARIAQAMTRAIDAWFAPA